MFQDQSFKHITVKGHRTEPSYPYLCLSEIELDGYYRKKIINHK